MFDRNQDNTFEFEHKAHNVLHNGRTFLVNHANPKEQHLFLQHKLHPHLKFEFQVHFSEAELQSSGRFCTTARTLQSGNCFLLLIYDLLLILFIFFLNFRRTIYSGYINVPSSRSSWFWLKFRLNSQI